MVVAGTQSWYDPYRQGLADAFTKKYGIRVVFTKARAEADVVALSRDPGLRELSDLAPYRPELFSQIPSSDREASGLWLNDYLVTMSVGYNARALGYPGSLTELLKRAKKGSVVVLGGTADVEAMTFAALMMRCDESTCGSVAVGVDSLRELRSDGYLTSAGPLVGDIRKGDQQIAIGWDSGQRVLARQLQTWGVSWDRLTPHAGTVQAAHGIGIRRAAPHPAAARLWMEFLLSGTSQNMLLNASVMPILFRYLASIGGVDKSILPNAPLFPVSPERPTTDDIAAARKQIGQAPEFRPRE